MPRSNRDGPECDPASQFGGIRDHGTQSAGVLVMADNTLGGVGIVPRAKLLVASGFQERADGSVLFDGANAAMLASARLDPDDILLIELEETDFTPIETNPAFFSAIAAATARGITVIEPGGNGPCNGSLGRFFDLDTFVVPSRSFRALSRSDGLDSGAVLVAACQSGLVPGTVARSPTDYSPRGRRIDCFAYGEHVLSSSRVEPLTVTINPPGRVEPNLAKDSHIPGLSRAIECVCADSGRGGLHSGASQSDSESALAPC